MNKIITLFLMLGVQVLLGQTTTTVYRNPQDSTSNSYQFILPDRTPVRGLIVRDYSRLPPEKTTIPYPFQWKKLALAKGLAILYTVTSNTPSELYDQDTGPMLLDEIIHEVTESYDLSNVPVFIGGISASGTRALRFAQFCAQEKSKFNTQITGAFAVDAPLDLERFYYSALKHQHLFKAGMLEEAQFVVPEFLRRLGCTPKEHPLVYRKASVFSYRDSLGGNARYYKNIPLLFFHEPDLNWWMEERGATYYDMNAFDIAGFVQLVRQMGHPDVELITTTGKGYDRQGNRNCHSWSIVDEVYLVEWMLKRIK